MHQLDLREVTVIFYEDNSLELYHEVHNFPQNETGRVVIPQSFKVGKSILAVCKGEIQILNKLGDRILAMEHVS